MSPPLSVATNATPRRSSSASLPRRWAVSPERPSVMTGGCSSRSRVSGACPACRAATSSRWIAHAWSYSTRPRRRTAIAGRGPRGCESRSIDGAASARVMGRVKVSGALRGRNRTEGNRFDVVLLSGSRLLEPRPGRRERGRVDGRTVASGERGDDLGGQRREEDPVAVVAGGVEKPGEIGVLTENREIVPGSGAKTRPTRLDGRRGEGGNGGRGSPDERLDGRRVHALVEARVLDRGPDDDAAVVPRDAVRAAPA